MTTKLTLTVEKEVIDRAKRYAEKNGRSLSDLIENYLRMLVQKGDVEQSLSPTVKSLLGVVKALKKLESITETIDCTGGVIKDALDSDFRDFEDAIQYFAAMNTKQLAGIVTRDLKHFKKSKLPIFRSG